MTGPIRAPRSRSGTWPSPTARSPALQGLTLDIMTNEILSIIGPSNCGKTSFLRDAQPAERPRAAHPDDGHDPARRRGHLPGHRRRGPAQAGRHDLRPADPPAALHLRQRRLRAAHGRRPRQRRPRPARRESSLRAAYLWDEVKDRLGSSASKLSGGQQQRLCIARTLALEPEVILFDEPCSGLDPISTAKVEESMTELEEEPHHRPGHQQHQAGRPGRDADGVLPDGRAGRDRADGHDLHRARGQADGRLHRREVRMSDAKIEVREARTSGTATSTP